MSASSKKKLRKEQAAEMLTEKQLQEKKEAKKLKIYTAVFAGIMAVVVLSALVLGVSQLVSNSGIIQRNTTGVQINDHKLSSAELNYFYVDAINNYYSNMQNEYGQYAAIYAQMLGGPDFSKPLNEQAYTTDKAMTWADYYANVAVDQAKSTYALYDKAMADKHQLTDDEVESMELNLDTMGFYATVYYGYTELEGYLKAIYGSGATEKSYREYAEVCALAQSYFDAHAESIKYEDTDLRNYEKDHFDEFSSFTFHSFYMNKNDFLTGGTKDENGNTTYSDDEKAAALKACEAAVESMKKLGITSGEGLDKAISLQTPYKDNKSAVSSANTDVMYANVTEVIAKWLADKSRKEGDFTAIANTTTIKNEDGTETTNTLGYYLVVFEGRNDNTMPLVNVRHILKQFEGGTTKDGKTVYTEAEKQAALNKLNTVKDKWLSGDKSDASFAALVKDNTDDAGSKENGGLYEKVYPGQMVEAFNDWCFGERKAGDYEVVETEYGYHLIYFKGNADVNYRDYMIENTLLNEDMTKWHEELVKNTTSSSINIKYLDLDRVIQASN